MTVGAQDQITWWSGQLHSTAELAEAAALYRRVFGYGGSQFSLNPLLLQGMLANGGSAVGVRDEHDQLVAFAYGFAGTDGIKTYHYSQAAVVDPEIQGKGLGRTLKLAQREVALQWGMTAMRWAFDPVYSRNAHFNLDVLGGRGVLFKPDFYGTAQTDRLIIEWDLVDQKQRPRPSVPTELARQRWGASLEDGAGFWVPIPSHLVAGGAVTDPEVTEARRELSRVLSELIGDGMVAVSCQRVTEATSAYRLERAVTS